MGVLGTFPRLRFLALRREHRLGGAYQRGRSLHVLGLGDCVRDLGAGSRDFRWNLGGTDADLKAAWNELQTGWSWQAQSGTTLEWGRLWADVKGALGEIDSITAVVGPLFS